MAQNDMNVANQGFPAFRADLNDQLEALVTNSSGATAPATTFPHQWWLDTSTTPSTLRQRNAANDAWIVVGLLNQSTNTFNLPVAQGGTGRATLTSNNLILGAGTGAVNFVAPGTSGNVLTSNGTTWQSTAPGGNFTNIAYTGTLTGGTGVINIGSGQLYKDASGNLGIGTSSPDYRLTNAGNLAFTNATSPTDGAGNPQRNGIGWMCTAGPTVLSAFITANNQGNFGADLSFYIRNAGGGNIIERARIANDGQQLSVIAGSGVNTLFSEFKCRAWVNFNGVGGANVRASGNVSSVARNGTGHYTVNFSTAMPDGNYALCGIGRLDSSSDQRVPDIGIRRGSTPGTTSVQIQCTEGQQTAFDCDFVTVSITR